MNIPGELRYTETHEWIRTGEGGTAELGITEYAAKELGDMVAVNLPGPGESYGAGDIIADVENVKGVTYIYTPFDCKIEEANEELLDDPGKVGEAPYEAWFVRMTHEPAKEPLLDAEAYAAHCAAEAK